MNLSKTGWRKKEEEDENGSLTTEEEEEMVQSQRFKSRFPDLPCWLESFQSIEFCDKLASEMIELLVRHQEVEPKVFHYTFRLAAMKFRLSVDVSLF